MDQGQQTNKPQEEAKTQEEIKPQNKKRSVILIIEDDPVLARMYMEKFKFEGFDVMIAKDGEEGLKMAQNEDIDLILLDIMLPRMSGIDLLEKYRMTAKGKKMKVLALTNLAEPDEKEKALKLGVLEYLVKAMQTPEEVVNKVKKYLSSN